MSLKGKGCLNPLTDSLGEMIEIIVAGVEIEEFRGLTAMSVPIDCQERNLFVTKLSRRKVLVVPS